MTLILRQICYSIDDLQSCINKQRFRPIEFTPLIPLAGVIVPSDFHLLLLPRRGLHRALPHASLLSSKTCPHLPFLIRQVAAAMNPLRDSLSHLLTAEFNSNVSDKIGALNGHTQPQNLL